MKNFLKFSGVAFLVALGLAWAFGWSFWAILILLEVAYGIHFLHATNPKTATAIGILVVFVLIGGWMWSYFKGNFPISNENLPWTKNNLDVLLTKLTDPGLSKAKSVLIRELRTKEDDFATKIPTLMQNGNYDDIKKRTQELINLRKDIDKLLTQTNPPPVPVQKTGLASTLSPGFETMPVGVHYFTIQKNTSTDWIKIPGNAYWDLSSTKTGNFKLIAYDGKVITYTAEEEKISDFPNQAMVFKIQSDEEMGFILKVKPKA